MKIMTNFKNSHTSLFFFLFVFFSLFLFFFFFPESNNYIAYTMERFWHQNNSYMFIKAASLYTLNHAQSL